MDCIPRRRSPSPFSAVPALLAVLAVLAVPVPALGQDAADTRWGRPTGDSPLLSLGAGAFNVTDDESPTSDFRLEYRHDRRFFWFKPWAGIELTGDGGVWGGGGVLIDLYFGDHVVVTASTGAGGYAAGSGKDLGAVTEFRSQLEVAWRFDDNSRVAVAFGHISNAGIGDKNPGAETATLYYHLPLDRAVAWLD